MFKSLKACLPFGKPPKKEKYLTKPNKKEQEPEKQKDFFSLEKKENATTKLIPANRVTNK